MSMSFKASPDGTHGEILVNGQVVAKLPVSGNAVIPNLVGTVSQSGGIPTGAVVERGSNANGEYVRFADGTQICFGLKNTSTAADETMNYPAAFSTPPNILTTRQGGSTAIYFAMFANVGVASATWATYSQAFSKVGSIVFSVVVVGRWY